MLTSNAIECRVLNMTIEIQQDAPTRRLTHYQLLSDGHGSEDVFHVQFDPESEAVTHRIVTSVATIKNVKPTQLTPLGHSVDIDMLETFTDPHANSALYCSSISLQYEGMDITVNTGGDIWLEWNEDLEKL